MVTAYSDTSDEFVFKQYKECTNHYYSLKEATVSDCILWRTDDGRYHTQSSQTAKKCLLAVGELLDVKLFSSNPGTVNVV